MNQKIFRTLIAAAVVFVFSAADSFAQQAVDQYGFGNKVFMIQSALEVGKSANGLWDIPGTPKKTDGNLKGSKWLQMGVYQREKGDPEDRVFNFRAAQGSAVGRYFIYIGRGGYWGVNAIDMTGKIEARSRADHFELKHMGNGRWKIYYKPGVIVCLEANTAKNGTKLVLRPDQNGPHTEWVFFDTATNKSFIPVSTGNSSENKFSYKGTLKAAIASKHPGTQYFQYATGDQFNSENTNGELQSYLNDKETSDQWSALLNLVKAVKDNKDTEARRSMYKAMSEANIKPAGNFAERLLQGKFVEQINAVGNSERDSLSKGYITTIAGKIR
ncbi:MAG TPA: hypothetical protein PLT13_14810 [Spirochaetota bacterium]|nr:hypothetical protein [Spirochaetota bacterium]